MSTRRDFLGTVGGTVAAGSLATAAASAEQTDDQQQRRKLAVITTVWRYHSHSWHMAERFLVGYPLRGRWHRPAFEVVSAYVDQTPKGDLSHRRAEEFGFRIYKTIAEALRAGGKRLAVDAVLIIGEHGDYPVNNIGQKQYPRYQFFRQVAEVFRADGRRVPVFNDKHLSWNFPWASEMVHTAEKMGFAFLAGSSLPVTWRMPDVDMPAGADIEEVLGVAFGPTDIYDFHALEMIQCMVERRAGGERGVTAMHALRGPAVWKAVNAGNWQKGGWDPRLFEACLSRSHTLAQPETFSHRYPTVRQMQQFVKDPIAYRFDYTDGLKATMLLMNGLVQDFTFAARLKGREEPLSTLFHLPPNPNVVYSAALMSQAERMFVTGRAPYPVKRTLLTSGLVEAGLRSLATGQQRLLTPHLAIRYQAPRESTYWRS
jgi:hypothetical protein